MTRPGDTKEGQLFRIEQKTDLKDALLYDFDIDDQTLKEVHKRYLDEAISFMRDNLSERKKTVKPGQPAWTASIDGFASRTGEATYNVRLSAFRESAVEGYLIDHMKGDLFNEVHIDRTFHGFNDQIKKGEDPLARSVRLVIHRPGLPPKPIPLPEIDKGTTEFQIRMLGVISIGKVLAKDVAFFQIVDIKHKQTAFFTYGKSLGLSFPTPAPPLSVTLSGPFTNFRTNKSAELKDFEGDASFGQPPAAGFSVAKSQLSINGHTFISKGISTIPHSIPISTGATIGITIFSATEGTLTMEPATILPFTEP